MTTDLPERLSGKATDSPWFWIYLFSTFALIGLLIMQAKFVSRQTAIERKGLGRGTMLEQNADPGSGTEIHAASDKQTLRTVSLRPLILVLALALCVGWIVFWSQQLRRRSNAHPRTSAAGVDDPGKTGDNSAGS